MRTTTDKFIATSLNKAAALGAISASELSKVLAILEAAAEGLGREADKNMLGAGILADRAEVLSLIAGQIVVPARS